MLSLELAVMAAYGMTSSLFTNFSSHRAESKIPLDVSEQVLLAVLHVEGNWRTNLRVLQQIIVNYIALAAHRNFL